jgi:16S rRNA (guanine966-N2)-methyltransferase
LEAASRGARAVLLVESDPRAARVIRANIASLDLGAVCQLRACTVASAVAAPVAEPFDVVFADPPYSLGEEELGALLDALVAHEWLAPDGVVVVERSSRTAEPRWPLYVTSHRAKRYGESMLWYGRRA